MGSELQAHIGEYEAFSTRYRVAHHSFWIGRARDGSDIVAGRDHTSSGEDADLHGVESETPQPVHSNGLYSMRGEIGYCSP